MSDLGGTASHDFDCPYCGVTCTATNFKRSGKVTVQHVEPQCHTAFELSKQPNGHVTLMKEAHEKRLDDARRREEKKTSEG